MTQLPSFPNAGCLLIGDELLSGRTADVNAHRLAGRLHERGIPLIEVRVVPDEAPAIIEALRALKAKAGLVFTSGGIGPTHDDITADAVAEALHAPIRENEEALAMLKAHYDARGEELTPARRRMAGGSPAIWASMASLIRWPPCSISSPSNPTRPIPAPRVTTGAR